MMPTKHHESHRASASTVTVTPAVNGIQSGVQHLASACDLARVRVHDLGEVKDETEVARELAVGIVAPLRAGDNFFTLRG
jgi:hypothetical protein